MFVRDESLYSRINYNCPDGEISLVGECPGH